MTFEHAWSPLLSGRQNKKVHQDERNVFARTILHATGPGGGRWFKNGYGAKVGARVVVLLRRRDTAKRTFKRFVHELLGPALEAAPGVVELRTQTFLPFVKAMWNTPDVAHDYPRDKQFHASIVVGASDRPALEQVLATVTTRLERELRE